jgi:hypothetical protein
LNGCLCFCLVGLIYSDYIVYVDESGDHSLESIDTEYPLFVLSFCIFHKQIYSNIITPALRNLKFSTFGHDMTVLHENDIRKKMGDFSSLNKESRELFMKALSELIAAVEFTLIAVVIDKLSLKESYLDPRNPYHLAMGFGLEMLYLYMQKNNQDDHLTHIVFEARGKKEDAELDQEFRRTRDRKNNSFGKNLPFEMIIADKKTNSEGLQFADMTARPIGLSVLRPNQSNRAFEILKKKFYRDETGSIIGCGLNHFPQKAKNPEVALKV